MIFTFVGCQKDKEKTLIELLIGKWDKQSAYYEYYENGLKTGDLYDTFDPNEYVYEFLANGDGSFFENGTLKESFTWSFVENVATIEIPGEQIEGEINIENDILTIAGSETFSANGINYENKKTLTLKRL